jgi:hypothetical protein
MPAEYRPVLWILAWWFFIALAANTVRIYHLGDFPPLWDNLAYQISGLNIARAFLESNFNLLVNSLADRGPVGYEVALGLSYIILGFHLFSPYVVSALFGALCLLVCYRLAIQLGARNDVALVGVLFLALLPGFIYQNCLQTRNDFAVAFFITLSWLLILQALERQDARRAFLSGITAGVGTLFKLSAPGYLLWGFILLLFFRLPGARTPFVTKAKYVILFALGAVLSCGWFYLPALPETWEYYALWSKMSEWRSAQYALHSPIDRILFYVRNLIVVHLSYPYAVALFLTLAGFIGYRLMTQKGAWAHAFRQWVSHSPFLLTLLAGVCAIIFLTLRGSLSSLGDVPVLLLLAAATIALVSQTVSSVRTGPVFSALLCITLVVGFFYSISHLHLEKPQAGKDYSLFAQEIEDFRDSYALDTVPFLQVFSHPVYNADTAIWLWHMNRVYPPARLKKSRIMDRSKLFFPEVPELIAKKLEAIPFLMISERNAVEIGGEPFHTFNRLHAEINRALERGQHFVRKGTIVLDHGHFPIHLCINRNFAMFSPVEMTPDGWAEWGSRNEFFALGPVKLRWTGRPIREIKQIVLVCEDSGENVALQLVNVLPDGRYQYESDTVMPSDQKRTYALMADAKHVIPASPQDSRKLAFRDVSTEVVFLNECS